MDINHISGTADHLRCCQLRWTVSVVMYTSDGVGHQFITLTVDICVQHYGPEALRRAGLSAVAETCMSGVYIVPSAAAVN